MFYYERPKIQDVFEYSRQSLDEKDVRQTHSLPLQEQFNAEFADRFNLRIVDRFVDDASAKIPNNRPGFAAMLKELKTGNPKVKRAEGILAWHPDRLSRNGLEAGQLVQMIVDEQIKDLFFPTYHFHNDPSGIEHLMMEFGRAISYSGWLSINSKRGSTGREQQGAWVYGRSKFGYTKLRECPEHPKRCSLFPIPDSKTFPARKRLVELWLDGTCDEQCSVILKREFGLTVKRSTISSIRRDPFNYGVYVIKEGSEDERKIDFRELKTPDGKAFEAVTDEITFSKFQSSFRQQQPQKLRTKHVNPLPRVAKCSSCKAKLRPARRKILQAGGHYNSQLGYECQTTGCKQKRIRAIVLFDQVAQQIEEKFGTLEKRHYQQYLVGLRSFVKVEKEKSRATRARLSKRLQKVELEKSSVIEKRITAINAYEFDDETRKWCSDRIKELNREIAEIKENLKSLGLDENSKVRTFKQFIELKENLHQIWLYANDQQKHALCEKLILNLEIRGQEIRSMKWLEPASSWLKIPNFQNGGANKQLLEPYFHSLWSCSLEIEEKWLNLLTDVKLEIMETQKLNNEFQCLEIDPMNNK